jgi:glycerol-3-phosphate acyltransferase PlsX
MRIAIDAMGGDNAPLEIVKGTIAAANINTEVEIVLIGDEKAILESLSTIEATLPKNVKIVHTEEAVTMEDDPMVVMKEKANSSMALGLQMLKDDEVDAFLSAGNTGALHVGSTLMIRKIKGVRRSAIATVLPFHKPILMLDSGANPEVTEDILYQWAIIGSAYSNLMVTQQALPTRQDFCLHLM